jgi:hypothetical protein
MSIQEENAHLREALHWLLSMGVRKSVLVQVGSDVGALVELHWDGASVVDLPDHLKTLLWKEGFKVLDARARNVHEGARI